MRKVLFLLFVCVGCGQNLKTDQFDDLPESSGPNAGQPLINIASSPQLQVDRAGNALRTVNGFVEKYSPSGHLLWRQAGASPGITVDPLHTTITFDRGGHVYFVGIVMDNEALVLRKFDSQGRVLLSRSLTLRDMRGFLTIEFQPWLYSPRLAAVEVGENLYLSLVLRGSSSSNEVTAIARINSMGGLQWVKLVRPVPGQGSSPLSMAASFFDGIYLSVSSKLTATSSASTQHLLKFSSQGELLVSRAVNDAQFSTVKKGNGFDEIYSLVQNALLKRDGRTFADLERTDVALTGLSSAILPKADGSTLVLVERRDQNTQQTQAILFSPVGEIQLQRILRSWDVGTENGNEIPFNFHHFIPGHLGEFCIMYDFNAYSYITTTALERTEVQP